MTIQVATQPGRCIQGIRVLQGMDTIVDKTITKNKQLLLEQLIQTPSNRNAMS